MGSTRDGLARILDDTTQITALEKNVDAILKMERPQNNKQLRSFIGAVNYYHDLWPRQSHILKPLTDLTGKGAWEWRPEHEQAFKKMKALTASDVLMLYPNHNYSCRNLHMLPIVKLVSA
jgi:hypothetical protein